MSSRARADERRFGRERGRVCVRRAWSPTYSPSVALRQNHTKMTRRASKTPRAAAAVRSPTMPDEPDSRNRGAFSESGAFELTDLGACSFLDSPSAVSPSSITPRSLSENVDAVCNSGLPTQRASCPRTGRPVATTRLRVVRRGLLVLRRIGGGMTDRAPASARRSRVRQRPQMRRTSCQTTGWTRRSRTSLAHRAHPAARAPSWRRSTGRCSIRRRAPPSWLAIPGLNSGSQRAVSSTSPRFGWDDEELDRPLDPDELRRRVGRRTDGIPQSAIFRRRRPRPEASSSDSELP